MGNPQTEDIIDERKDRWKQELIFIDATPQILIAKRSDGQAELIINPNLEWKSVLVVLKDAITAIEAQS